MKSKTKSIFLILFLLLALVAYTVYRGHVYKRTVARLPDDSVIGQGRPVLLELGALWCTFCRQMMPALGDLSKSYSEYFTVAYVDIDQDTAARQTYSVGPIPLILFFDAQGNEIYRQTGTMTKQGILKKWQELGLDLP